MSFEMNLLESDADQHKVPEAHSAEAAELERKLEALAEGFEQEMRSFFDGLQAFIASGGDIRIYEAALDRGVRALDYGKERIASMRADLDKKKHDSL